MLCRTNAALPIDLLSDETLRRDFLAVDVTELRRHALAVSIPPPNTEPQPSEQQVLEEGEYICHMNCDMAVCGRAFKTRAALQQHRSRGLGGIHGSVHLAILVQTNQCPWCASALASRASAMQHVRGAFSSGTCKVDRGFLSTGVEEFDSVQCPLCEETFESVQPYHWHVRSHLHGPDLEVCCDDIVEEHLEDIF